MNLHSIRLLFHGKFKFKTEKFKLLLSVCCTDTTKNNRTIHYNYYIPLSMISQRIKRPDRGADH
jgi:hypothetical protein